MNKKNIVFIIHELTVGGAERVLVNMMNNISRDNFKINLIIFKNIGELKNELKKDINIIDLKSSSIKNGVFKLFKTIKEIKPDIVFSGIAHVNLMLAVMIPFLPKHIKYIARETNTVSSQLKQEKRQFLLKILYKYFYSNFDLIIAQSNYMKQDLVDNFSIDENLIKVIYNPIDIELINDKKESDIILFNKNNINLLSVGRLNYQKGYDLLLKAIEKMNEKFHLYIIGDGEEKEKLLNLSKELNIEDRVHFLGFQKNPYKYMDQADLLILSSRYEGLPNVVLEANACGLPVVAYNCPCGTREIIKDGVNGFLVECENIDELTNKIEEAVIYNWDKEKIIQYVYENFSITKILDFYTKELL